MNLSTYPTLTHDIFVATVDLILLGIGYIVGRTGISTAITDIKNDISSIKNWINPTQTTTVVATPASPSPTVVSTGTTNTVV